MTIIEILQGVFNGTIPEGDGSTIKQTTDVTHRGEVTSPIARRLYHVYVSMSIFARSLTREHERFHVEHSGYAGHNCHAFRMRIKLIETYCTILYNLLWQTICEEQPVFGLNKLGIMDGWSIVSDNKYQWIDTSVTDTWNMVTNYMDHIKAIVRGELRDISDEHLDPVARDEEVIGTLSDLRTQNFWLTITEFDNELSRRASATATTLRSYKKPEDVPASLVISLGEHFGHPKRLRDTTMFLFLCGVRDAVEATADLPVFGIRRAWEIVKFGDRGGGEVS